MKNVTCIIHIRNGEIINKSAVRKAFDSLKSKDGVWFADFEDKRKRSLPQNSYYWMILTEYIQPGLYEAGWREIKTKEDAHDFVRGLFLKSKSVNEISGETVERIKSTTELTTSQFSEYLDEIAQWAAEYLSIQIPSPNQQLEVFE